MHPDWFYTLNFIPNMFQSQDGLKGQKTARIIFLKKLNFFVDMGRRLWYIIACGCAGVAQLVEQLICNQQVGGSSPSTSSTSRFQKLNMGEFPSGQRGQTVNLLR